MLRIKISLLSEVFKFKSYAPIENRKILKSMIFANDFCIFCDKIGSLICFTCKLPVCKSCFHSHSNGPVLKLSKTRIDKKVKIFLSAMRYADSGLMIKLNEIKNSQIFRILTYVSSRCVQCFSYLTACDCDSYYHICVRCYLF